MGFALGLGGGGAINAPTDIALTSTSTNDGLAIGGTIGVFSATDADVGETFTFELIADVSELFDVSGTNLISTGALTVGSHTIVARVTDSSGATFDETFVIDVVSANLAPTDIILTRTASTAAASAKFGMVSGQHTLFNLSNNDRTITKNSIQAGQSRTMRGVTAGLYYCEFTASASGDNVMMVGVCDSSYTIDVGTAVLGTLSNSISYNNSTGQVKLNGTVLATLSGWGTGVAGMELDATNKTVRFRLDGGSWSTTYSIAAFTGELFPAATTTSVNTVTANFAAAHWSYAAPVGASPFPSGGPALKGVGAIAATANTTAIAPAYPTVTTINANDLIIVSVWTDVVGGALNVPAGYTAMYPGDIINVASRTNLFWKRAVGGESGTLALTQTSAGGVNDVFAASIDVFNNVIDTGRPYEALVIGIDDGVSTLAGSAITTLGTYRLALQYFLGGGAGIYNDADGWTHFATSRFTTVGNDAELFAGMQTSDGGTVAASTESATGVSTEYSSWTFALIGRSQAVRAAMGYSIDVTATAGTALYDITGTDPDSGESLTLTFSEQADPSNKFTVSSGQVLLSGTLTAGVGYSLTIRATDVHGATYDELFTLTGVDAWVRVTQAFAEVIYDRPPTIRVSQAFTEVPYLSSATPAKVRVTQAFTEVIYS